MQWPTNEYWGKRSGTTTKERGRHFQQKRTPASKNKHSGPHGGEARMRNTPQRPRK